MAGETGLEGRKLSCVLTGLTVVFFGGVLNNIGGGLLGSKTTEVLTFFGKIALVELSVEVAGLNVPG